MKRRDFLNLVGGGIVLAATGLPNAARAQARDALAPWRTAGAQERDARRRALSYAILAPNPHNRQPWLVDLDEPNVVTLLVDPAKTLPETDPFNRQITIGLGCFLELMVMAAAEDGLRVDLDLFPAGGASGPLSGAPVARATFTRDPAVRPDPLFAHVLARRSNKAPYDMGRPVEAAALDRLFAATGHGSHVAGTVEPDEVEAIRALTIAGIELELLASENDAGEPSTCCASVRRRWMPARTAST